MRVATKIAALILLTGGTAESGSWLTKATNDQIKRALGQRSQSVKAAHDFAAGLGNANEAKSIQTFAAAYDLAIRNAGDSAKLMAAPNAFSKPSVATKPTAWQQAALNSETFQRNFIKTVDATINQAAILGDPVPIEWRIKDGQITDSFTDCVAVGRDHHFYCSGTIIGRHVVLTAGHCSNGEKVPKPNMILLGPSINDGTTIEVVKIIPHPKLNLGQHPFNDVALLILKDAVPDTVTVRKIASAEQLYHAFAITVAGFGITASTGNVAFGVKRSTDVPIVTYDGSQPEGAAPFGCDVGLEFAASALGIFRPWVPAPPDEQGKPAIYHPDTCNGDSGGPAYVRGEGDNFVLAGATSRPIANAKEYLSPGERPTDCGDGGIYVRTDKYWSSWIEQTISDEHLSSP